MFFKLTVQQLWHKRVVALLVFLAMTALVTLYVYLSNTSTFANRSMQLVMKNMGHNLLLLPQEADLQAVYLCSEEQTTFPEKTTRELAKHRKLMSRYYVSVLQSRVAIAGQSFILTGIEPMARKDESREKGNMVLPLAEDEARLGSETARRLGRKLGDEIEVDGQKFKIVEVLPPKASLDDCRVYVNLHQCQKMLGKIGEIHFILAFLCLHSGSLQRGLETQETMLADGLASHSGPPWLRYPQISNSLACHISPELRRMLDSQEQRGDTIENTTTLDREPNVLRLRG